LLLAPPKAPASGRHATDVSVLLSRMWHFPTVQVRVNAVKELRAFVNKKVFGDHQPSWKIQELPKVRHTVTYHQITVLPFRLNVGKLPRVPHAKCLAVADLSSVPISNLTRKVGHVALATENGPTLPPDQDQQELRPT
jgi:adenine-specific DNA glycosylase